MSATDTPSSSSDSDDATASGPSHPHQLHHQKNRKRQYRFSPATDELLLRKTLAHNPFVADFGAVGATWKKVADALGVGIDGRRCRERVAILLKKHKMNEQVYGGGGGGTEEGVPSNLFSHNTAETDRMLREVALLADALPADRKQENNASAVVVAPVIEESEQQQQQQSQEEQQTREVPVPEESGSNVERKRPRGEDPRPVDLLSFLLAHEASERKAKLKTLELEEKKLALEERRLKLKEEKARHEAQEKNAMISMILALTQKLSS